ncbi:MAG: hypothetical protein KC549_11560 [Myxococcales bacterium]|nr:hypothetical protein [Myxococcales bacterium]
MGGLLLILVTVLVLADRVTGTVLYGCPGSNGADLPNGAHLIVPYGGGRVEVGGVIWVGLPAEGRQPALVDPLPLTDLRLVLRRVGSDTERPLQVVRSFEWEVRLLVVSTPPDVEAGAAYEVLIRRKSGWGMGGLRLVGFEEVQQELGAGTSGLGAYRRDILGSIGIFRGPARRTLRLLMAEGRLAARNRTEDRLLKAVRRSLGLEAEVSLGQIVFEEPGTRLHPAPDASAHAMVMHSDNPEEGAMLIVQVRTDSQADFVVTLSRNRQTSHRIDWGAVQGVAVFPNVGPMSGSRGVRTSRIGDRCHFGSSRVPAVDLGGMYMNLVDDRGQPFALRQWTWLMMN